MNDINIKDRKTVGGYSRLVGCIYVFNLIVGTGALALPKAFQQAGWLFGGIVLSLLCFLSYVTSTYVIEAMSISNGFQKLSKLKYITTTGEPYTADDVDDEATKTLLTYKRSYGFTQEIIRENPLTQSTESLISQSEQNIAKESYFEITDVFEMGQMAILYFNRVGLICFYLSMCIYLYGDLSVYAASVATTIRDIACTYRLNYTISNGSATIVGHVITDIDPCWPDSTISRINAYRIFLTGFVILFCPFVFFNLTKTKIIQYATVSMRWLAFAIMFTLMSIYLARGKINLHPKVIDLSMSPNLLGVSIYSFMCHHSLPSLITPINKKNNIFLLFFFNFIIILIFYLILSFLSTFTFTDIQSLITLNFQPNVQHNQPPITDISVLQYYLALFPVFSISASFPIIGITLRNNLQNLISCGTGRRFNIWFMDRMFYPLLAIIPPIIIVYVTNNITILVGFTGSYAGTLIQYVIPISLVICARKNIDKFLSKFHDQSIGNDQLIQLYQSPFRHIAWCIVILAWSVISIVFVSVNNLM